MLCPECEEPMRILKTEQSARRTTRTQMCPACGVKYESTEEITHTYKHRQSPAAISGRGCPPTATGADPSALVYAGGVGGGLSSDLSGDRNPNPSGSFGASGSSPEGDLKSDRTRAKASKSPGYTDAFKAFWLAYPRKVAKGAAWKMWQKHAPQLADVLKALAWQRTSFDWRKDTGAFIPHPATYLNDRRWEDEPKGAPGSIPALSLRSLSVADAEHRAILARHADEQIERGRREAAERFRREKDGDGAALAPPPWMQMADGLKGAS